MREPGGGERGLPTQGCKDWERWWFIQVPGMSLCWLLAPTLIATCGSKTAFLGDSLWVWAETLTAGWNVVGRGGLLAQSKSIPCFLTFKLEVPVGQPVRPTTPRPVSAGCGTSSVIWEGNGLLAEENVQWVFPWVRQLFRETPGSSLGSFRLKPSSPWGCPSLYLSAATYDVEEACLAQSLVGDTPSGWAGCQTLPQPSEMSKKKI